MTAIYTDIKLSAEPRLFFADLRSSRLEPVVKKKDLADPFDCSRVRKSEILTHQSPFYLFMIRMTFTGNFEGVKLNKIDDPRVPRK